MSSPVTGSAEMPAEDQARGTFECTRVVKRNSSGLTHCWKGRDHIPSLFKRKEGNMWLVITEHKKQIDNHWKFQRQELSSTSDKVKCHQKKIHLGQKLRFCSDHGNNRAESTVSVHISTPDSREQCAEKWAVGTCLALNCRWLQHSAVREEDHEFKHSLGCRGKTWRETKGG